MINTSIYFHFGCNLSRIFISVDELFKENNITKLMMCVRNDDERKKVNFEKIVSELRYFISVISALEPKVRSISNDKLSTLYIDTF